MESDLDKKLSSIIDDLVIKDSDPDFMGTDLVVEQIKQAFKEAGYEIIPTDTIPTFKSYLKQVMTGQEWYDRFEDKLDITINYRTADEYQGKMKLVEQIKRCARRAAGIEGTE